MLNNKYFNNIIWLFLDKILRLFLNIFILGQIAQYIGSSKFGTYNFAISLGGIFTSIANLGIDNFVIKHIVENPKEENTVLNSTVFLKTISSIICFAFILLFGMFYFKDKFLFYVVIIQSISLLFLPFEVFDVYFQSKVKSKIPAFCRFTIFLVFTIIKVVFIYKEVAFISFVWLGTLEFVFNFILIGFVFNSLKGFAFIKSYFFSLETSKKIIKGSWPIFFGAVSISIYMRFDQILISKMDSMQGGYYSAAIRVSEIWNVLPVIILSTIYPFIIKLKNISEQDYLILLKFLYSAIFSIAFVICIFTFIFSEKIIILLYGNSFIFSSKILQIYIWSSLFVFVGILNSYVLLIENKIHVYLIGTVLGACINILFNFYLIPKYGVYGGAISTLFSYFISVFFVFLYPISNFRFFVNIFNSKYEFPKVF